MQFWIIHSKNGLKSLEKVDKKIQTELVYAMGITIIAFNWHTGGKT